MSRKVHAMFTIEALLVMPVVLFSVISVIYISFYLYDYCRIQGVSDLLLHKAALNLKHEADIETGEVFYENMEKKRLSYKAVSDSEKDNMEKLLMAKLSEGLLAAKITDIEISLNFSKIAVSVEGEFRVPIKGVAQMLFFKKVFKVTGERQLHNPADTVRISEVVLKLGSRIKGTDEVRKILESIY